MDELLELPGAHPAGAFLMSGRLVVGELVDREGFGRLVTATGEAGDMAHGSRLGPDGTQFAVGVTLPSGSFVTPGPHDVYTMGPLSIDQALSETSGYKNINFS
jgi:hypothetical protein